MPFATNTAPRVIHLKEAMLVPGVATEVTADDLKGPQVEAWIKAGEIEVSDKEPDAAPEPKADAKPAQRR